MYYHTTFMKLKKINLTYISYYVKSDSIIFIDEKIIRIFFVNIYQRVFKNNILKAKSTLQLYFTCLICD